jgi:hypothetical protein
MRRVECHRGALRPGPQHGSRGFPRNPLSFYPSVSAKLPWSGSRTDRLPLREVIRHVWAKWSKRMDQREWAPWEPESRQ